MNEHLIGEVLNELRPALVGRPWGKIFQLSAAALAVDFRTGDGRYLLLSAEPGRTRLHLIARSVRELEKSALAPSQFALVLRKALGGATLRALERDEGERVVRFHFSVPDAVGDERAATLVAQLTGRSANLLLLDEGERVAATLRPSRGEGQEEGELYHPPAPQGTNAPTAPGTNTPTASGTDASTAPAANAPAAPDTNAPAAPGMNAPTAPDANARAGRHTATPREGEAGDARAESRASRPARKAQDFPREGFASLSEALDQHYLQLEAERAFDARAGAAAARLRQQAAALRKLRDNLRRDLAAHGDADEHKRAGDLLIANIGTAAREGRTVLVTDFYAEDTPTVEIEVDENRTLQEEAGRRFARYSKARRAAREIAERLEKVEPELEALEARREELERIRAARDADALAAFTGEGDEAARAKRGERARRSKEEAGGGARALRRYRSSDGYEIIVGRGARENDHLTFRVARSYDTWMHAADYPGSHVVVRARGRDEVVPHRTLVEAARLAAHFSQARKDAKVAVNYTQRKFVSKPRGAAPGLVYLSSFRTLLVEPGEGLERI